MSLKGKPVRIEVSQVIDRPPADVFQFVAVDHVLNHPRWLIHDGPVEMRGRQSIEPEGPDRSTLTITIEIPGVGNPLDPLPLAESLRRIRELIESER